MPASALPLSGSSSVTSLGLRAVLALLAVASLYGSSWLALAPNRLLPGQPVSGLAAIGPATHLLALAILVACLPSARRSVIPIGLLFVMLCVELVATGLAAKALLEGRPSAARAMLGANFWCGTGALLALLLERARQVGSRWSVPLAVAAVAAMLAGGYAAGLFDSLSLAVEYKARAAAVHAAFVQHIVLSLGALFLALLITVPLGWAAQHSARLEAAINAFLAAVQVIPAIALFGLLIPLLAAVLGLFPGLRDLGLRAIGPTPALIGVAIYLALPLLRGFVSGLKATDPAVVEAAQAMGMTELRTTVEIRIPLGLPILLAAVRVATVQSIGLITLGGLIGAGGLGAIVFEGMSQFASDLILLGAFPIILLALAADSALAGATRLIEGSGP